VIVYPDANLNVAAVVKTGENAAILNRR